MHGYVYVLIPRRRREYQKLDISNLLAERGIDSNQLMLKNAVSNYLSLEVIHVACADFIKYSYFNVPVCSWLFPSVWCPCFNLKSCTFPVLLTAYKYKYVCTSGSFCVCYFALCNTRYSTMRTLTVVLQRNGWL